MIEEALLCRESPDCDNALKKLSKVCENRAPCIRLHPAKIPTRIEIPYGKLAIYEPDDDGRENE